jgi:hypothetical protein
MPPDGAAPEVVAAAGTEADDHLHGLAGREIGLRVEGARRDQQCRQHEHRQMSLFGSHAFPHTAVGRATRMTAKWLQARRLRART